MSRSRLGLEAERLGSRLGLGHEGLVSIPAVWAEQSAMCRLNAVWKYGIMKDLHNTGLRGRLPCFIEGFLRNRNFCVRLGSCLSDLHEQEMGVPQGSILSVTLFGLKINSIVKAISPGVDCSLYVDDFLICYRSKHIHIIERHLQQCLNKLYDWADTNGFKFSATKTVCIHFCWKSVNVMGKMWRCAFLTY